MRHGGPRNMNRWPKPFGNTASAAEREDAVSHGSSMAAASGIWTGEDGGGAVVYIQNPGRIELVEVKRAVP